ncbi:hypothetical protein, partial [Streptococcus pneumoniae]|uniref:hypothetical protein n=1 Tax=Streptococcus pneumoniae TaxID=1313 RepID=UPI001E414881
SAKDMRMKDDVVPAYQPNSPRVLLLSASSSLNSQPHQRRNFTAAAPVENHPPLFVGKLTRISTFDFFLSQS